MKQSIWIGWDPAESDAYNVALRSMLRRMGESIPVHKLSLANLQDRGWYARPTHKNENRLIDELSARDDYDGSISTEHAIARFLVPRCAIEGWALFVDGDIIVRDDICQIFDGLDPAKAVYCVKHRYEPVDNIKKAGQVQTRYERKNWSSVMVFNCDHPSNGRLSWRDFNTKPGRDLHAFC